MTKETKNFRILICILLALTMICSVFFAVLFVLHIEKDVMAEEYGIYVAGVPVTPDNEDDILGDGTVCYDPYNNILIFDNATIEFEYTTVYSKIDLTIQLIGENTFVSTYEDYSIGIYASDNHLTKDLAILGDGSLTIELPNAGTEAIGIYASDLTIMSDVTVKTSDCEHAVNGIACTSSLLIGNKATVTVNNGAGFFSSAVRVRGNAFFDEGTALKVSVNPGTTGICKGLSVSGDLVLSKDTALAVSIDDGATDLGECLRVSGLLEIGAGSTVTASAKNAHAIECLGSMEANKNAKISAISQQNDIDVFCSGALVQYGATIDGEINALGGIHNRVEQ